ncbi:hypothetical protein BH09VER1_BH09VER1_13860 [soil metagenome]
MKTTLVSGQPSWPFSSDKVQASITEAGGHLAPVRFRLGPQSVEPFSIAPWATEKLAPGTPQILKSLRGDFFCAPFGGNEAAFRGESHPVHGDSANAKWHFESLDKTKDSSLLHLSLKTKVRPGRVDKFIELRKGHTALYCRHILSGATGPMNFGHHAMLLFPDSPGSGRISTSRLRFGQVFPGVFEHPAKGGYPSLKAGAPFSRLDRVPAADGTTADLSSYPARRGFEDLVMFTHQDSDDFAWTAVAFPAQGYVWFALKDPRVLKSTVFWHSNAGRHYAPWSSRHINVLGLEDVTSYFHYGLKESASANPWSRKGIATSVNLSPGDPLVVNYIMGVARIPKSFTRVKAIQRNPKGLTLISTTGQRVATPLDLDFLY